MLENMRSFARVVETGSFSEAARRMRVSANVMSHRIQALEAHLGCRLFNRTTRRMSLTEQGRVFYDHVIEALQILDEAQANIGELGVLPRGVIRVAAPLGLGRRLVAPVAAIYQDAHPMIDVQLRLTERRIDPIAEAIDLTLQFTDQSDPGMIMRKIGDARRLLQIGAGECDQMKPRVADQRRAQLCRHGCVQAWTENLYESLAQHGATVTGAERGDRIARAEGTRVRSKWRHSEAEPLQRVT